MYRVRNLLDVDETILKEALSPIRYTVLHKPVIVRDSVLWMIPTEFSASHSYNPLSSGLRDEICKSPSSRRSIRADEINLVLSEKQQY